VFLDFQQGYSTVLVSYPSLLRHYSSAGKSAGDYDAKSDRFATPVCATSDWSSEKLGSHFGNLTNATRQTLAQLTHLSNPVARYDQSVAIWKPITVADWKNGRIFMTTLRPKIRCVN